VQDLTYDLIVVGAGSGGFAAARTARSLGARVALVDSGPLGGLCILRGCMPSKTLLASGDAAQEIREAGKLGVHAPEPVIDFRQMMARKREIIQGFAGYRIEGIKTFPLFEGRARFLSPTALCVGDELTLHAKHFVIATGSVIAPPTVPGLAEAGYIDSDDALSLEAPPKSLIVLGGGYVAAELGQFMHRIGVPTTMVLRSAHLLSGEDRDVGTALTEALREEGLAIETDALLHHVQRGADRKKVVFFTQRGLRTSVAADEILYTLGRIPNIAGLDLEKAGVKVHPKGGIDVDQTLRTSNPDIFAVGDVTGRFLLVHVAIYQGEIAARNALRDGSEEADYAIVKAHTVFSDPQVAIVGDTEKDLSRAGVDYLAASYPFSDHGKAISVGKTKGFVKMLAAPADGRILGVAIVGPDASDLIHEAIVAMHYRATVFEFVKIPHLHPTMAEILTYPAEELVERIGGAERLPLPAAAAAS
jgi:pyruvate/2-oxoglutarate dehydrogenase complex dihydrolipoamide dehydrogenase (E3) component